MCAVFHQEIFHTPEYMQSIIIISVLHVRFKYRTHVVEPHPDIQYAAALGENRGRLTMMMLSPFSTTSRRGAWYIYGTSYVFLSTWCTIGGTSTPSSAPCPRYQPTPRTKRSIATFRSHASNLQGKIRLNLHEAKPDNTKSTTPEYIMKGPIIK